jgi:hypothetical protein
MASRRAGTREMADLTSVPGDEPRWARKSGSATSSEARPGRDSVATQTGGRPARSDTCAVGGAPPLSWAGSSRRSLRRIRASPRQLRRRGGSHARLPGSPGPCRAGPRASSLPPPGSRSAGADDGPGEGPSRPPHRGQARGDRGIADVRSHGEPPLATNPVWAAPRGHLTTLPSSRHVDLRRPDLLLHEGGVTHRQTGQRDGDQDRQMGGATMSGLWGSGRTTPTAVLADRWRDVAIMRS